MERNTESSRTADSIAELAFDAWFGRTLRSMYEPVMHETLPDRLALLLREMPAPRDRDGAPL